MGLRTKIFIILSILITAVFVGQVVVVKTVLFPQFIQLEEKSARRDMERIQQAIVGELANLDILCHDWSVWDDAVAFVEGQKPDFVRVNIPDEFFGESVVDCLYFINSQGEVVYRRAIDPLTREVFSLPGGAEDVLAGLIFGQDSETSMKTGLLSVDDVPEPLLLSVRSIFPSDHSGAARGIIAMGRFLREDVLQQQVGVNLTFGSVAEPARLSADEQNILALLQGGGKTPLLRYKQDSIYFYSLQNSISGPALGLIIGKKPADIILHGKSAIHSFMGYSFFVSLVFLVAVVLLMSRIVTEPIRAFCWQVRKIVSSGDFSTVIDGGNSGEIGEMRQSVNSLLQRIQSHEQLLSEANSKLLAQSLTDSLTGLANRRKFDTYVEAEWGRLQRNNLPLSIIMCDVDFFKKYNDAYGHQKGDSCLQTLATALGDLCQRPADLVARYGGEEFVVVLPETDAAGAVHVGRSICQGVCDLGLEHVVSAVSPFVTMSVGVTTLIPSEQHDPDYLVRMADAALYQAKEQGRNRVVVFEE